MIGGDSARDLLTAQLSELGSALLDEDPELAPILVRPDESLLDFVKRVKPQIKLYRHTRAIIKQLQRVADGQLKRLMIWMPPRLGKSEIVTRLFPAYLLARYPRMDVGICSYGSDLATELSKDARDLYEDAGGKIDKSMRAKRRWMSLVGGSVWAAGVAGTIRGRGYHVGIVDDPHKGLEDIDSDAVRQKTERWWPNVWLNRQHMFATGMPQAIVVVMQRLATNDLCGFLLDQPDAASWTVLALDLERDLDPYDVPEGVTIIEDWRTTEGELLCPDLISEERLKEIHASPDERDAQYQQRPNARSGQILPRSHFRRIGIEYVPQLMRKVMAVDLAVSKKQSADFTVGMAGGIGSTGMIYLFNPYRERVESPDALDGIALYCRRHRAQQVGVEAVAYQLSFVQHLRRRPDMGAVPVLAIEVDKDKVARARGWSPLGASGLITLVDDGSGWIETFLSEAEKFPRGKHDDQVDVVGTIISMLQNITYGSAPLTGGTR